MEVCALIFRGACPAHQLSVAIIANCFAIVGAGKYSSSLHMKVRWESLLRLDWYLSMKKTDAQYDPYSNLYDLFTILSRLSFSQNLVRRNRQIFLQAASCHEVFWQQLPLKIVFRGRDHTTHKRAKML
ncbi:hypothetical protein TNCV_1294841 [Trichonephila clavipes]|nr:hypothetical protein TNCV_1294841 [Trichonephila clavipes]